LQHGIKFDIYVTAFSCLFLGPIFALAFVFPIGPWYLYLILLLLVSHSTSIIGPLARSFQRSNIEEFSINICSANDQCKIPAMPNRRPTLSEVVLVDMPTFLDPHDYNLMVTILCSHPKLTQRFKEFAARDFNLDALHLHEHILHFENSWRWLTIAQIVEENTVIQFNNSKTMIRKGSDASQLKLVPEQNNLIGDNEMRIESVTREIIYIMDGNNLMESSGACETSPVAALISQASRIWSTYFVDNRVQHIPEAAVDILKEELRKGQYYSSMFGSVKKINLEYVFKTLWEKVKTFLLFKLVLIPFFV
jgi:hypothetical protein